MPRRAEQTIAYRIYHKGTDFLGTATIELPQVQFMTETLSGSGIAGEIENPTLADTQAMSAKLSFIALEDYYFKTLDFTETALWECYVASQISDDATSVRESIPHQINLLGRVKSFTLGTLEQGKKQAAEVEMEVTRLEYIIDGEQQLLYDKYNFIKKVRGDDKLAKIRSQIGLNG